jgi:hypothetical protein
VNVNRFGQPIGDPVDGWIAPSNFDDSGAQRRSLGEFKKG